MASQPVPVDACSGWLNTCSFCDKRFSAWIPIEEDYGMNSVPNKPGAFMFSLESKRGKEVVSIGMQEANIQISVFPELRYLKQQISERRSKDSKASILLRYAVLEDNSSKEACCIYAHWRNSEILPRMTAVWPGIEILENSQDFEYYDMSQKWCYPVKNTVWKKQKVNIVPQGVIKCKGWTESCSYCDGKFTNWMPVEEAVTRKEVNGGAPERAGFSMYAVSKKGKRQIVHISEHPSVRQDVISNKSWILSQVKSKQPEDSGFPVFEVRWMTVRDLEDIDSCFMYAHFLNYGTKPLVSQELPGVKVLENSENFVFRNRNRQWCFDDAQSARPKLISKAKGKRDMLRSMMEEYD